MQTPDALALIAGNGVYPLLLAESAKKQGVRRLFAVAFKRETDTGLEKYADEVKWIHLGQLGAMLEALRSSGVKHAVMAGQITPTHLFSIRMDDAMLELLKRLQVRNAETIFGAVAGELKAIGIELMPASLFMASHMPEAGLLSKRAPSQAEQTDIDLGIKVARMTSDLDVGQTVVVKQGTILAVEAFEGTNDAIQRAGRLGGPGIVIVKLAKTTHDMRFDIPVIGMHTMKLLKKTEAAVLAVEAQRSIILEREKVVEEANKFNLCLTAVKL
jgi:UDP-2,3-diacylglucosamine hydrolase